MNEKKTAEEYFHLSKNEFGKMWLMYNPEGGGRYKCWEPIAGEFWNEFEKLQNAAQETAALREENELLKRSMKQGNEMYANLKFDDEPFTPYQLVLQENERLKEAVKELIEISEEMFTVLNYKGNPYVRRIQPRIENAKKLTS